MSGVNTSKVKLSNIPGIRIAKALIVGLMDVINDSTFFMT